MSIMLRFNRCCRDRMPLEYTTSSDRVGGWHGWGFFCILWVSHEAQSFIGVSGKSLCAAEAERLGEGTVNPNHRIGSSPLVPAKGLVLLPLAVEPGSSQLATTWGSRQNTVLSVLLKWAARRGECGDTSL